MNYSEIAKKLGSKGGKNSAASRFKGLSKEEISAAMREVRNEKLTKEQREEMNESLMERMSQQGEDHIKNHPELFPDDSK